MRPIGAVLVAVGATVSGLLLMLFAALSNANSGDMQIAPSTGMWALPAGVMLVVSGIAALRSDRAAATAASLAVLPLIHGIAIASIGPVAVQYGLWLVVPALLTMLGAALVLRAGARPEPLVDGRGVEPPRPSRDTSS